MAIVDVRNVPTIVEVGPSSIVADFTEEQVVAQVMVGPTVVEFSWGELVPEPGLRGGGPFEGTVTIGPWIPGLPETTEAVDPVLDRIMVWDESMQMHVQRPAILGGGGDGGGDDSTYVGVNVGTGAEVYKDSNQVADPREHRLRSIVGRDRITVTEEPDEIIIGGGGGLSDGVIPTIYVGTATLPCGTASTSLVPGVNIPGVQAGDFIVWVYWWGFQTNDSGYAMATLPTGWSHFKLPASFGADGVSQFFGVAYKFMEADELLTTHTITEHNSALRQICSKAYAFRNVHPDLPLTIMSIFDLDDTGEPNTGLGHPPMPVDFEGQHVIHVRHAFSSSFETPLDPWPWAATSGFSVFDAPPYIDDYLAPIQTTGTDGTSRHRIALGVLAAQFEDENWFANETINDSLVAGDWVGTAVDRYARSLGGRWTNVGAQASTGRHYFERTVNLVAGERYTFAALLCEEWSNDKALALSVVTPSNVEYAEGREFASNNWVVLGGRLGSGYGTHWRVKHYNSTISGIPSLRGGWLAHYFIAQETGPHKLRFNFAQPSVPNLTLSYTGSPGVTQRFGIAHMLFRRGFQWPHFIPTPDGARMAEDVGTVTRRTYLRGHLNPQDRNWGSFAFAVQPNSAPRVVRPDSATVTRADIHGHAFTLADGYTYAWEQVAWCADEDFENNETAVTRPIYPTIGGVLQKYYWEFTFEGGTADGKHAVGIAVAGATVNRGQLALTALEGCYAWRGNTLRGWNGASLQTVTEINGGDTVGVALDFTTRELRFYRNGTQVGTTITIPDLFPGSGTAPGWLDSNGAPWWAIFKAREYREVTLRLRPEQWLYSPPSVDYIGYDWAGDPTVSSYSPPAIVTGAGAGFLYIDELTGELKQRSLIGNDGIGVIQYSTYVEATLSFDALPITAHDRANDSIAFYDASTGSHARRSIADLIPISPTTTRGDLIARGPSADVRVPLGVSGKFLSSDGVDVVWADPPGGGPSALPTTPAPRWGDTILHDGTSWLVWSKRNILYVWQDFLETPNATPWAGWDAITSGTGAAIGQNATGNRPGVVGLIAGTTTTGRAAIANTRDITVASVSGIRLGSGRTLLRMAANVWTVPPTDANNASMRLGLGNIWNNAVNDGVYVSASGSGATRFWQLTTRAGGVSTSTATDVPIVQGQYYLFEIEVAADRSQATLRIDGVLKATNTTNIPATSVSLDLGAEIVKASGTTSVGFDIDYMELMQLITRP